LRDGAAAEPAWYEDKLGEAIAEPASQLEILLAMLSQPGKLGLDARKAFAQALVIVKHPEVSPDEDRRIFRQLLSLPESSQTSASAAAARGRQPTRSPRRGRAPSRGGAVRELGYDSQFETSMSLVTPPDACGVLPRQSVDTPILRLLGQRVDRCGRKEHTLSPWTIPNRVGESSAAFLVWSKSELSCMCFLTRHCNYRQWICLGAVIRQAMRREPTLPGRARLAEFFSRERVLSLLHADRPTAAEPARFQWFLGGLDDPWSIYVRASHNDDPQEPRDRDNHKHRTTVLAISDVLWDFAHGPGSRATSTFNEQVRAARILVAGSGTRCFWARAAT